MAVEIKLPKLGETMEDGIISQWLVREGGRVERGQGLFEVQTDKVNIEYESPAAGYLLKILVPAGENVPVLTVVGYLGEQGESAPEAVVSGRADEAQPAVLPVAPTEVPARAETAPGIRESVSPRARRLAREAGIDPERLPGSGPGGRVVAADVEKTVLVRAENRATPVGVPPRPTPAAPAPAPEPGRRIPLSQMRKVIARRLTESFSGIPHFYLKMTADLTDLLALRAKFKDDEVLHGISVTDFLARAVALTLRDIPAFHVSLIGEEIVRHDRVNLGIAVALEDGLVVPVVRDADRLSLFQLSQAVKDLSQRAREGRLGMDDYNGGTFTLSNLGMYGVDEFSAIINPPEAGILAVGRAIPTVVPHGDGFAVRQMLVLTLSCDHRVVDGAVGAAFLAKVKGFLEAPYRMMV